jgi:hypothetical protein
LTIAADHARTDDFLALCPMNFGRAANGSRFITRA